jgi:hypothetical protein
MAAAPRDDLAEFAGKHVPSPFVDAIYLSMAIGAGTATKATRKIAARLSGIG